MGLAVLQQMQTSVTVLCSLCKKFGPQEPVDAVRHVSLYFHGQIPTCPRSQQELSGVGQRGDEAMGSRWRNVAW